MLVFGERLNACQWTGVLLARVSLFMLSRSSRREGVDFAHNVGILCIALAAVTGAVSGLYDKYIMARLDPVFVPSWYNLYQFFMMAVLTAAGWWPKRHEVVVLLKSTFVISSPHSAKIERPNSTCTSRPPNERW